MTKLSDLIRTMALLAVIVILVWLCCMRLMKIQVVNGEEYLAASRQTRSGNQLVPAARGEIYDSKMRPITVNRASYNIVIEKSFFPSGEENDIINRLTKILDDVGQEWEETIPISKTKPYTFNADSDKDISKIKTELGLNVYATAENCMDALYEKYDLDSRFTEEERRTIAAIRYEMLINDFSMDNRFTLAKDISSEAMLKVKELSYVLGGVNIAEEAVRVYKEGDVAPHIIGTVRSINEKEYTDLKSQGYRINDKIGDFGIERGLEDYLRGKDGVLSTVQNSFGEVISNEMTTPVEPGNSLVMTLDMDFQRKIQKALEKHIKALQKEKDNKSARDCDAGAVVVLDVKTGAVLASATYPSYDLNEYIDNYKDVESREGKPLNNRAINGLYRPGSTYKTVTALAALRSGSITESTVFNCTHTYNHYPNLTFKCVGWHGNTSVVHSLRVSCNIFFYEAGRFTGINEIEKTSLELGLGQDLNMEIYNNPGTLSSPETSKSLGRSWYPADIAQVSIGQLDTFISPVQMAVQAMTLANEGTRYRPHFVKSIYDYNLDEVISETEPIVEHQIKGADDSFDIVREGMIQVGWNQLGGGTTNVGFPFDVALKTGSPQVSQDVFHAAMVGFAPAKDPEIAFALILEKGARPNLLTREILNAYFK